MSSYKTNDTLPSWLRDMTSGFLDEIKSQRVGVGKIESQPADELLEDMDFEDSTEDSEPSSEMGLFDSEPDSEEPELGIVSPEEEDYDSWFDNNSKKKEVVKPVKETVEPLIPKRSVERPKEADPIIDYNLKYDEKGHLRPKKPERIQYDFSDTKRIQYSTNK